MSERITESREARNARQLSPLLQVALLLGVLAHLLGFLVFRVASDPLPAPDDDSPFITLGSSETTEGPAGLPEQASLFDSAPLFIPGEWSAASEVFSSRAVQDWRNLPDFEPSIELKDEVRPDGMSLSRAYEVEQPSDLLALGFWDLFSHFGEEGSDFEAFEDRGAAAVVTIMGGSEAYPPDHTVHLDVELESGTGSARPVVLVLNMLAPGLPMGGPLLQQSSGSDALDAEVLEWLDRPATLAKLPAGFLELRVFP